MKIDIEYEAAGELAAVVIMNDYKAILADSHYDGDRDKLLDAYCTVMRYCTTDRQRAEQGVKL